MSAWPPAQVDWSWLGACSDAQLQRLGCHPASPAWIQQAYVGLRRHHPSWPVGLTEQSLEPPNDVTPVVLVRSDGAGVISWLHIELLLVNEVPTPQIDDAAAAAATMAALAGATAVGAWYQKATGAPCAPVLSGQVAAAGDSAAGAGFLAAVRALADFPAASRYDVCSAGWRADGQLEPVAPGTMLAKALAARRWGYQRLWVCAEQLGVEEVLQELQEPSSQQVLKICRLDAHPDQAIAQLLSAWDLQVDRVLARRPPRPQVFLAWTEAPEKAAVDGRLIRPSSENVPLPIWNADAPAPLLAALAQESRGAVLHAGPGTLAGPTTAAAHCLQVLVENAGPGQRLLTQAVVDILLRPRPPGLG